MRGSARRRQLTGRPEEEMFESRAALPLRCVSDEKVMFGNRSPPGRLPF